MRTRTCLLAAALLAASMPTIAAAQATQAPIQIKNLGSFAIKPSDMPQGCTVNRTWSTKSNGYDTTVICDTPEHFTAGFSFANADLSPSCSPVDGKTVCAIVPKSN